MILYSYFLRLKLEPNKICFPHRHLTSHNNYNFNNYTDSYDNIDNHDNNVTNNKVANDFKSKHIIDFTFKIISRIITVTNHLIQTRFQHHDGFVKCQYFECRFLIVGSICGLSQRSNHHRSRCRSCSSHSTHHSSCVFDPTVSRLYHSIPPRHFSSIVLSLQDVIHEIMSHLFFPCVGGFIHIDRSQYHVLFDAETNCTFKWYYLMVNPS